MMKVEIIMEVLDKIRRKILPSMRKTSGNRKMLTTMATIAMTTAVKMIATIMISWRRGKSEDANNNGNNCNDNSSEDDSNNNDLVEKAIVTKKTDLDILSMKPIVVVETEPDV